MGKIPVALQVYSVRDYAEKDFRGTMLRVKEMGYEGVELAGFYGLGKEQIKDSLEEAGLRCFSAHVSLEQMQSDIEKVLDEYLYLGCRYLAIPWLNEDRRANTPGFDSTLRDLNRIGASCTARGIKLLYHNHDFEFDRMTDGSYMLDYLFSHVAPRDLCFEPDVCWIKTAGEDPPSYIRRYSGRVPVVHLKDYYKDFEGGRMKELFNAEASGFRRFEFRPLGCGVLNLPPILEASSMAGAEWLVVEMDSSKVFTTLDSAEISRRYLRRLGW